MSNNVVIDNNLVHAALIASDQVYGATDKGFNLQWIDNTVTGVPQPFPTPAGWSIADQLPDTLSGKSGKGARLDLFRAEHTTNRAKSRKFE